MKAKLKEPDVFLPTLENVIKLQLEDLEHCCAKAELLCLIGCVNLIEFIGGILNGSLGVRGHEKARFIVGIRLLGGIYSNSEILGESRMWQLRCAVTHQYVPSISDTEMIIFGNYAVIKQIEKKPKEIIRSLKDKNRYMVDLNVSNLVSDLKKASFNLIERLKEDSEIRDTAQRQFNILPTLIRKSW